jgi:transcriptional regulator with XRE-family HTH domain
MPEKALIPGLAAKLKAAREAAGLSAEQAGAAAGVHFVSIYRIEKEERVPTLDVLYKLAAAYGLKSVCDLLPPPPSPKPPAKKPKGK